MKLYKVKILLPIILITFLFVSMQKGKNKDIVGIWKAVAFLNETGTSCFCNNEKPCLFELKLKKDNSYEYKMITFWSQEVKGKGSYKLINLNANNLCLNGNIEKKDGKDIIIEKVEAQFPISKLVKDTLVLNYNWCCTKDTCTSTSGRVIFVKQK